MTQQQHASVRHQHGVTLIEQIMVLVIVAVLAALAVPPLGRLLMRSRMQVAQMDFIAAMQNARATAVTTGKQTMVCPTSDGKSCSTDSRWEFGWLVANDTDHDNQPDGQTPLQTGQGYGGKLAIRSAAGRRLVRFQPDGSAGGTNLTLLLCDPAGKEPVLSVVVSNSGRVRGASATTTQSTDCIAAE